MDALYLAATVVVWLLALGALAVWGYLLGTQVLQWWRYRRIGRMTTTTTRRMTMWTPDSDDRAEVDRMISESQRPAPGLELTPEEARWMRRALEEERTECFVGLLLASGAGCMAIGVLLGWLLRAAVTG